MNNITPPLKDWKELYKASIEFKNIDAWNWMDDTNIFGVQNPANGEIGYCCILGNLGEVFGLVAYTGTKGLEGYLKMQSDSYFILHHHLTGNYNYKLEFLDQFFSVIEEYKLIPQEVLVKRKELFKLIEPITSDLEIKLSLVKRLKAVRSAKNSMLGSLK